MSDNGPATPRPFSQPIYIAAAFLDPSFKMFWIDEDVMVGEELKESIKNNVEGKVI